MLAVETLPLRFSFAPANPPQPVFVEVEVAGQVAGSVRVVNYNDKEAVVKFH